MKQSELGSSPQTLRQMNCAAVLRAVRGLGSARVRELMDATGLSRPTVAAAIAQLTADGWVEEGDSPSDAPPRMGRPARVVRFKANAQYVLGVDVGPHKVYGVAADLNGTTVADARRAVTGRHSPARLLAAIGEVLGEILERIGVPDSRLAAVGLGTPGVVDSSGGTVVQAPSLPGGTRLELRDMVQRRLPCPVHIENDVNLAAVSERHSGTSGDASCMLLVHWGARVGAAVLVHGRVHRGGHGAAGEIGYVDLNERPGAADPAGLGPLELQAGTGWIARRAAALGLGGSGGALAVLGAAAAGDARALQAVDEACAHLARGLAPSVAALDPELVVLAGSIRLAGGAVVEALERHLRPRVLVLPELRLSAFGEEAVAQGAVRLALADAEQRLHAAYDPAAGG